MLSKAKGRQEGRSQGRREGKDRRGKEGEGRQPGQKELDEEQGGQSPQTEPSAASKTSYNVPSLWAPCSLRCHLRLRHTAQWRGLTPPG